MEQRQAARLVEETMKTLYAWALSRVSHKEDAENLAGDIIAAVLENAQKIYDEHVFYGFLWAVASNMYKKFLRNSHRIEAAELDENAADDNSSMDKTLADREELKALHRELSLLSREYRECTVAYYFDGLSCGDTAQRLGISLDMVKYYLFKTRKILREGIGMDIEFGEKSYNPGIFEYSPIFFGSCTSEYHDLFRNRKIPGSILLSAYNTPMTIRELSVELGIASVYMEDELALLERYDLIKCAGNGRGAQKYQTNMVIFTLDYVKELTKKLETEYTVKISEIIAFIRDRLPEVRAIGFRGCDIKDNNLLWSLYTIAIFNGCNLFNDIYEKQFYEKKRLCTDAVGIPVGRDFSYVDKPYPCNGFIGRAGVETAFTFIDFGVLDSHICEKYEAVNKIITESKTNRAAAVFPVFVDGGEIINSDYVPGGEYSDIMQILKQPVEKMSVLFDVIYKTAADIMRHHAPAALAGQVDYVMYYFLLNEIMGWLGAAALQSGALQKPENGEMASICGYIKE